MSAEPNLQDLEKVYRITVEQGERIKVIEEHVKRLADHTPSSGLFSKNILIRIITVGIYVFAINTAWSIASSIITSIPSLARLYSKDDLTNAAIYGVVAAVMIAFMLLIRRIERTD